MKKSVPTALEMCRVQTGPWKSNPSYGFNGAFEIPFHGVYLRVIASDQEQWDHVSVSLPQRCPTHVELTHIKDLFWDDFETVVHYWPPKSEYVDTHPFCLHLWKPQNALIPLPPLRFV